MTLPTPSTPPSPPRKWVLFAILGTAFLGFLDATYLTVAFYQRTPLQCGLLGGCDVVTTSRFATVGGVPVALLGSLYYLTLIFMVVAAHDLKRSAFLRIAARLTLVGFVFSLWLTGVQTFVLRAFCFYCLLSAASSTLLFILSFFLPVWRRGRREPEPVV